MYKLKQILTGATFALLTGLATMSGTAIATTPDGETPANEGVCDVLQGGTGGLYGLCVAYCEAQDLDTFDKEPPRTKILENYNKKKQAGDPDMPCLQVPCPCWTADELGSIHADGQAVCLAGSTKLQIVNTTVDIARQFAEADINAGRERCRYIDLNTDPRTLRSFSITPDEAASCHAQVTDACLGL